MTTSQPIDASIEVRFAERQAPELARRPLLSEPPPLGTRPSRLRSALQAGTGGTASSHPKPPRLQVGIATDWTPRAAPHGRRSTQSTPTTLLDGPGVQQTIVALRTARKGPATFETRRSRRRRVRPRPPLPRSRMVANFSEEEAMAHTKLVIGTTKRGSPTAPAYAVSRSSNAYQAAPD
jgi:hypothetical protein